MMDDKTYDRFLILLKTPAGVHRWCPRPGCDTPFIKADVTSSSPQVTCKNSACELIFCYECRVKWHEGETCEEFKLKQRNTKTEEEVLSETYALENLQECPNCNIWVEKIDGCEYVMCTACHHEFCWDCLEPHDHNMGAHVHGAKYKPSHRQLHRVRQARAVRIAKLAGIGVATCVLGPPMIAIGAAAAVVVFPALGIVRLSKFVVRKHRQRTLKKRVAKEAKLIRKKITAEHGVYLEDFVKR
jgi:hypothetical protein